MVFRCMDVLQYMYRFSCHMHLCRFPFGAIIHSAAENILIHAYWCTCEKKRYCTSLECSVTFPHTKKTVTNHNVPQRAERHADRVTASWRMGTGNGDIVKTGCWGHAGMKCWFPHLPKCVLPPSVSGATGRSPLHTFSWGIGGGG